jgi:hypothetical protein
MAKGRPDEASLFTFEITINDERRTFTEPAPEGFPPEFFPHLAEFWKRGFTACLRRREAQAKDADECLQKVDLSALAAPLSGRPANPEIQKRGKLASELHEQGLTYGEIALQLCPRRTERHHRHSKKCADRIQQEAKDYENRGAIRDLTKPE